MRSIIIVLLLIYSSVSLAEEVTQSFNCDINKVQTKDFSEDMFGYEQSDYERVFPEWLSRANAGDKKYQFYVAKAYYFGQGVSQNKKRALDWYKKSSDQGYSLAKNNLSFFYSDAEIVDQDLETYFKLLCEAATGGLSLATMNLALYYSQINSDDKRVLKWMLKAAIQGNANAQNELGLLYFNGIGGAIRSKQSAYKWIQESANQGYDLAQNNLGWMYQNGEGVSKNYKKAFEWYQKSALQGQYDAQNNLGFMYESGTGTSKNFKKAFEWYQKSAIQGNSLAQNNLGSMYENGYGTAVNYDLAFEWYLKSEKQGNESANTNLEQMYELRMGLLLNPKKAFNWYEKFAIQGNPKAQAYLGYLHQIGQGTAKDDKKAFEWYQKSAIQGYDLSQYSLGLFYENGKGTPKNLKKAFEWYQKSAKQGYMESQYNLALLYVDGRGVTKDLSKAFEWYQKSADQGSVEAQYNLALLYVDGRGVTKDLSKAFEWFQKSAKQGYMKAQYNLALMYENGRGVNKDSKKAFEWFKKSADQGSVEAQYNLGWKYHFGEGVNKDFKKAFEWYKKSATQGNSRAQYNLALMYENGEGVNKDFKEAFEWYKKSAIQGDAFAQNNLGFYYATGKGVPKNTKKAFELYLKSATQGHAIAQNNLAQMYYYGEAVVRDLNKAFEWYKKAAKQGHADAQVELAAMYAKGNGVPKNSKKAFEWYLKSATQGNAYAQNNLGVAYGLGEGVPQNYKKAFEWYLKSATQGYPTAQNNLGTMYFEGRGTKQDYEKAIEWYEKSANAGFNLSLMNLSKAYGQGFGVEKDDEKAAELYAEYSKNTYLEAQSNLINCLTPSCSNLDEKTNIIIENSQTEYDFIQMSEIQANSFSKISNVIEPIDVLEELAIKGDVLAQRKLGVIYWWGKGVEDKKLSLYWTKKAAQQGDSEAQNNLGTFYYNGELINIDLDKAFDWYQMSANQGNALAMRNLGSFYLLINQDFNNAIKYFKMAFDHGEISAAWNLGYLYMKGLNGNEIDEKLAYEWMLKGAKANYKPAQFELSKFLLEGKGIKKNEQTSFNWLLKSSRKQERQYGEWDDLIRQELSYRYFYGIGVEASLVEAQKIDPNYIMELITDGAISSQQLHQMAQGYEFELKDLEKARFWYEKAAEKGSIHAQRRAGLLYSTFANSAGLIPDYDKAEFWFLKAIEQGDLESMTGLAELYYDEMEMPGVPNTLYNPSKSFDLLIRAKESGASNYHMGLAYLYRHGIGTERDVQKALLIIEDKLESIEDWEKWYWMWDLWSIHVENNLSDDEAISRVMSYFIDLAKSGDVSATVMLAEMYLEENFEYFDEKEGIYWLNKVKDKSIKANFYLSEYADNYTEYGEFLLKAIELHETGKEQDFIVNETLIEIYFLAAAYFIEINIPEKVELFLRKVLLIIPENEDNPYHSLIQLTLSGLSQNYESSSAYLNDVINKPIIGDDSIEAEVPFKFNALVHLHEKYVDEKETEAALELAINAIKLIDLYESDQDYLSIRIILLELITKDYIQLGEFDKASSYFSQINDYLTIQSSDEYKRNYSRNTTISDNVHKIWRDIIGAVIKINKGSLDQGFDELNEVLDRVNEGEIPLRRYDLDFALIPLEYLTRNGDYDKATILMSKVISLYQQSVEKRLKYDSTVPTEEKEKIRDFISEYIYISSKGNNDLKDSGFKVMQLASGLTLSDTVIKSISMKELSGSLLIKSKLLEALNNERRSLIDEKFKSLSSGNEKIKTINIKLNDLDKKINALEKDLKGLGSDTLGTFITPAELVKENLSENDALITMLISNQRSYVWLTTKEGVFRHDSEMNLNEVSEHAQRLIKSLNPAQMGKTAFPVDSSSKLYELLIAPFKDKLNGIDRLIFSPDPILSQIPFSILTRSSGDSFDVVSGSDELRGAAVVKLSPTKEPVTNDLAKVDWLIKDYSIAVIPSVYSYVGLESYNSNEVVDSFLGIGNPVLSGSDVVLRGVDKVALSDQRGSISRTISDLTALPETEIELNTIAKFFTNSEVITQNDATERKIRDMDLSGFDVIAFATHALVSNEIDDLFEPAIVLTPVDSDNPENDGLLMASEIAELNMDADIVLLSACNTASAFGESNSQGLSGIADSFFEAGAKSLLVSYWSVISDSAVDITTRMFDKSNTGKSYAHRHRESILQLLKESNNYQTNPVYWAPFMVVGVN